MLVAHWDAWLTIAVLVGAIALMAYGISADLVLIAAVVLLLAFGIITPAQAFEGFSNQSVLTIAGLFVVAAGLRETGCLNGFANRVLGQPRNSVMALSRLVVPVSSISAFLNNTPIVAIMVPIVSDWSKRIGINKSQFMMPLSFASILGGTCTLIGHSTNLIVADMAQHYDPSATIGLFEPALIGVPVLIAGLLYMLAAARFLLPHHNSSTVNFDSSQEYLVAMRVEDNSPIVNQSIEEAGLRHLPGLYLVEIERQGEVMPAVAPTRKLRAGDILLFAGVVDSVADLRKIRGLVPATTQVEKLQQARPHRRLIEAVVAAHSSLIGKSVRQTRFRTTYDAAIIAVRRHGQRIASKVGDIELEAGDTLLLEARPSFAKRYRYDRNFALISVVEGSQTPHFEKGGVALSILIIMVLLNATGVLPLLTAVLIAAGAMVITRCLSGNQARRALDIEVLLSIAAAFGIGAAVEATEIAKFVGNGLVQTMQPFGTMGALTAIYLATAALGAVITTKAAAILMFPITTWTASQLGNDIHPYVFVLMFAGAGNFVTPIAYQTNLMVYGPGGYRFRDFIRFGLPLQFIVATVVIVMATWLWSA